MEVKEIHILFDTLFQQVYSNRKNIIRPEQKDLLFNQEQINFVKTHMSVVRDKTKGFEDKQRSLDELKSLYRTSALLPIIDSNVYAPNYAVYGILPPDYMHLVNCRSYHYYDCNGQTLTSIAGTIKRAEVTFKVDSGTSPFYDDMDIEVITSAGTTKVFDLSALPATYFPANVQSLKTEEARFYIINLILEYFNSVGTIAVSSGTVEFKVYWEKYGDTYKKNTFIFEVVSFVGSGATTLDSIKFNSTAAISDSANFASLISENIYNSSLFTGTLNEVETREISSSYLYTELKNPFGKTVPYSPISNLQNRKVRVFHDTTFGLTSIHIDYLKKPRLINYRHKINSDFDIEQCTEIILMAVKSAEGAVETPSYKNLAQEYITIE